MDKTIIGNKKIEIAETQGCRFWIHSVELGFGRWIYNNELRDLIKNKGK